VAQDGSRVQSFAKVSGGRISVQSKLAIRTLAEPDYSPRRNARGLATPKRKQNDVHIRGSLAPREYARQVVIGPSISEANEVLAQTFKIRALPVLNMLLLQNSPTQLAADRFFLALARPKDTDAVSARGWMGNKHLARRWTQFLPRWTDECSFSWTQPVACVRASSRWVRVPVSHLLQVPRIWRCNARQSHHQTQNAGGYGSE
jgi:hypothetical protein